VSGGGQIALIAVSPDQDTILTKTVYIPKAGSVVVTSSGILKFYHTLGQITSLYYFNNMDNETMPISGGVHLDGNIASGNRYLPFSATTVYDVTPGTHTFRLIANRNSVHTSGTPYFYATRMAVVYVPGTF
jgi:hypothetical protein